MKRAQVPGAGAPREPANRLFDRILRRYDRASLQADFDAICGFGGRVSGTRSERNAVEFLKAQLSALPNSRLSVQPVPYAGWTCQRALLVVASDTPPISVHPLIGSAPTPSSGLSAQIIDLGTGSEAAFQEAGSLLRGRLALVRHEYMFAPLHTHRIHKYNMAIAAGAAGMIVVNPLDDSGAVAGGVMAVEGRAIPAVGVSRAGGDLLSAAAQENRRVRLQVDTQRADSLCENLILDLDPDSPNSRGVFLISAHIDGHALSESAIDNASGLAVALQIGKTFAPLSRNLEQCVRICFFNVEEWGLLGSKAYLEGLATAERDSIALNLNLDSVAGAESLTALTSGFPELADILGAASRRADVPIRCYEPLMKNSDHYWFAEAGIPAMRLVAGFDDPESNVKYVLTENDRRNLVRTKELDSAYRLSAAMLACAMGHARR